MKETQKAQMDRKF